MCVVFLDWSAEHNFVVIRVDLNHPCHRLASRQRRCRRRLLAAGERCVDGDAGAGSPPAQVSENFWSAVCILRI